MNNSTKLFKIIISSLMIALVCIGTMIIQIPTGSGFINIGDSMIFIASAIFGPVVGMIAGGIGSALADILSGYVAWAIFTLIIKGLEGYIVGIIIRKTLNKSNIIVGCLVGTVVMVTGYFLAGAILQGSFLASMQSIPANILQGISSTVISIVVLNAMTKTTYFKKNIISE